MVCCDYLGHTGDSVTYAFGAYPEDITGIVIFFFRDGSFEIVKEPEKEKVYPRNLYRLLGKYREDFLQGSFSSRISFES